MPAVTVIGLGNVLVGDDAFGPHVVQTLQAEYEVGPEVSLLDLGTPGFDLIPYLMDTEALVVVDTVKSRSAPGTLRLYRREQILGRPPPPRLSPHEPGLMETLCTLDLIGKSPREVLLVGTVPADTSTGIRLSVPVAAAIRPAVEAVVAELERLGHPPTRRAEPQAAEMWWEGPPSPTRGEGRTAEPVSGAERFPLSQNWERGLGGEGLPPLARG